MRKFLFDIPVVLVSGNYVKKYYPSAYATIQDRYNPYSVLKVCAHAQKQHKGKVFRFASDCDIFAYKLLKELSQKGGGV